MGSVVVTRSGLAVFGLLAGTVLMANLLIGCSNEGEAILRGTKHSGDQISSSDEIKAQDVQGTSAVQRDDVSTMGDNGHSLDGNMGEMQGKNSAGNGKQRQKPLDLSLPNTGWYALGPQKLADMDELERNIIRSFEQRKNEQSDIKWSGKLHWDESEAAQQKPLQDSVKGAELEIRIRLP